MHHQDLAPPRLDRRRAGLVLSGVVGLVALVTLLVVGDAAQAMGDGAYTALIYVFGVLAYTGVGILILWNRPGHGIGRLTLAIGLGFSLSIILQATLGSLVFARVEWPLARDLLVAVRGGARALAEALPPAGIWAGGVLLISWFPDGRPTGRAGAIVVGLVIILVLIAATLALGEPLLRLVGAPPAQEPPLLLASLATMCLLLAFAVAVADLVGRYRGADPVRQAQIRWVAAAAGLCAVLTIAVIVSGAVLNLEIPGLWDVWIASMLLPVVAIGVAVTRYRLYDIDRIVSRSISYALVTALLFAVFGGLILLLQGLISGAVATPGAPIDPRVVAASTLVVAALFNPVRIRVQRLVDRRFHRARYDAERTVAGFAGRLRDQLDLPTLTGELGRSTADAVEPSQTAVWLRSGGPR